MNLWPSKLAFLITFGAASILELLLGAAVDQQPSSAGDQQEIFYPIRYKNCKSQFEVLSVAITTNCSSTDRCHFQRGSVFSIQIVFKPNHRVDSLQTAVWAHLGDAHGALTRFHIENENACANSNITCPVEPGQTYWYTQPVHILAEYPIVDVQVNWLLTNGDSPTAATATQRRAQPPRAREVCVKVLAKVVDEQSN